MPESQQHPPQLAKRLLSWVLREDLAEEVQGDLEEKFHLVATEKSIFRARLNYWYQAINYLRPFAIKKSRSVHSKYPIMFKYYIKLSWRNLLKQRTYSSIKIGGFALGIAAAILITLFIADELSYDQHYKDQDQIFRILNADEFPNKDLQKWSSFPAPIKRAIEDEFPELESVGRLINFDWFDAGSNQLRVVGEKSNIYEEGFVYADPELLGILEVPMVYGNHDALDQPETIVISRDKAEKYFPNENPIGKQIIINDENTYTIGGVMENPPSNTFLQFDFLLTLSEKEFWPGEQTFWGAWNYSAFVKLREGSDPKAFESKLDLIKEKYIVPFRREQGDIRVENMIKYHRFEVQPVANIHLYTQNTFDNLKHGDIKMVYLFGAIAIFTILLACINFINLSTAKLANRAREVGLQKVVGSSRIDIIRQYLTESFLYTTIAFVVGIFIVWLSIPYFNQLADKSLSIPWHIWWIYPAFLGFISVITFLSGLYPAFYLSGFRPIQVIRGAVSRGSKNSKLRGALVVFQFATSAVLIICTIVTYRQMDFILNKDLGFEKDQVLLIQGANTLGKESDAFKTELKRLPFVKNVTYTNYLPVEGLKRDGNSFWREGKRLEEEGIGAQKWRVDEDYLSTLGIKLLKGRNLSKDIASDSSAAIINEAMAQKMGFGDDALGQRITNGFEPTFHVIGVIEDFHFEDFKMSIKPLVLTRSNIGSVMAVKLNSDQLRANIEKISAIWETFMPDQSIRFTFMDDSYARSYAQVDRTSKVFTLFAILALIVACLGLFALSGFMVEQRGKEISVRKVLGASLTQIFTMLTGSFLKLVLIAMIIGAPVGWHLMDNWLHDYVYRIEITWDIFLITAAIAVSIALMTISFESMKAGLMNPVKKLRSE